MEFRERSNGTVTPPALELIDVCKRFGGVQALDGASLTLRAGTVHALLGENGAGKTTLMRVAFGLVAPDAGNVRVNGVTKRLRSPTDAIRAGISMVQQHFSLVPALTTLENIALGWTSSEQVRESAIKLARQTGLSLDPSATVDRLSVPDQQRVELLKALVRGARTLILDEPTAALSPREADDLFTWIRAFRAGGGSVVLITHKLREALDIADDVTVLREGVGVWSGARGQATLEGLAAAVLGQTMQGAERPLPRTIAQESALIVLADRVAVSDAKSVTRVRDASFSVRAGEVVGVAGVEGSGIIEFLYALAGRVPVSGGHIGLPDEIGFVPEDRHRDALLLDASVADNVALKSAGNRKGWLRRSSMEAAAAILVESNGIRPADVRLPVAALSGGNQQRLVLARELDGRPLLVVAINPTRGLDIAAARVVQHRLQQAAEQGTGIVYYSSDLDELLEIADRVVVVYAGRVHDVERNRDAIGRAMLGAT